MSEDKLMKARCRLMTIEPWYGHIAMSMNWVPSEMAWIENEESRTMGVRIVNGHDIECVYYPKFVEKQSIKELYGAIQHEIEHIVRCHCIRRGDKIMLAWNVATDMTINGPQASPRIGYKDESNGQLILPLGGKIIWIPNDWPKDWNADQYYNRLFKESKQGSEGSGEQGDEVDKNNCGHNFKSISGNMIDDHSTWDQSDVSEDEARQLIKDAVDQATEKCQGRIPGHLIEAINELSKPIVKWREILKQYLSKHLGNRRKTYSRRNRRFRQFSIPGISHHAAATVNVIVDTSGSIGTKELQQFFSEIETISHKAKTKILLWDSDFQGYNTYRRGDWKKFEVKGRGGTNMAAPVEWLIDNKAIADVQIMLTDGYCNYADEKPFPMVTVITTDADGPTWGNVVRMKIAA